MQARNHETGLTEQEIRTAERMRLSGIAYDDIIRWLEFRGHAVTVYQVRTAITDYRFGSPI